MGLLWKQLEDIRRKTGVTGVTSVLTEPNSLKNKANLQDTIQKNTCLVSVLTQENKIRAERIFEKVLSKINENYISGFFDWVKANRPDVHRTIKELENELNETWLRYQEGTESLLNFKRCVAGWYISLTNGLKEYSAFRNGNHDKAQRILFK
jgi:hypothetical protein